MAKSDKTRGRRVQSVEVGAALLLALAETRRAVTLSELAASVDMAPAKAHRYLASFIGCGLVDHRHNGRYDLGPAAVRMGLSACARVDLVGRTSDMLADLVAGMNAIALLSIWGPHGPTVIRIERNGPLTGGVLGLGITMALLDTATGNVFLSWLPRATTQTLLDEECAQRGGQDAAEPEAIIAATRRRGYAFSVQPSTLRIHSMAGPVLNANGVLEAVVTLVSPSQEMLDDADAIRAMRTGVGAQSWPHPRPILRGQSAFRPE